MAFVGDSQLRFRSPLSRPFDSDFPARDEFAPAPLQESSAVTTGLGTSRESIRYDVSTTDAFDLALFWFVFLVPIFFVSPMLVFFSGSPLPWIGVGVGLAGNAANAIAFLRLRARIDSSMRALLAAALEE